MVYLESLHQFEPCDPLLPPAGLLQDGQGRPPSVTHLLPHLTNRVNAATGRCTMYNIHGLMVLAHSPMLTFLDTNSRVANVVAIHDDLLQSNLDLRNPIYPFLNRTMFDLRKIYGINLKNGRQKKMSYVGEFAS